MKLSCGKCDHPIAMLDSLSATWRTPIKCSKCEACHYRSHPVSSLLFIVGCGLTIVLVLMAIFVTKNVFIDKILYAFGSSAVLFMAECILLPLKHLDLEKKEKKNEADRRELLWLAIFFGALLILSVLQQ